MPFDYDSPMHEAGIRKQWRFGDDVDNSAMGDMARQLGIHQLVATLLQRRGITDLEQAQSFLKPILRILISCTKVE